MRILFMCLLLTGLFSCGSGTESSEDLSDTLDVDTTIIIPDVDIDTTVAIRTELEPLELALEQLVQSRKQNIETMYRLELTASGYEYQTHATWYFDSLFLLAGRSQSWASEGTEGKSEHFFQLDKLFAFRDDNTNGSTTKTYTELFHRDFGGLKYEEDDGIHPDNINSVGLVSLSNEETDLKEQLKEIINSLRKHEKDMTREGDGVILLLKNNVSYGEETITETSEISLDKKLLAKLLE